MEFLLSYVRTIAVFLIFSSLIELILPSSNFKRYIDIILGLVMIIILITPLSNMLIEIEKPIDEIIVENQNQLSKEILNSEVLKYEDIQRQLIIDNYKEQIILQIAGLLEQKFDINSSDMNISIDISEDENNFGTLNSISIIFYNEIIDIDETNKIKITLGDFYNMSYDNIYI